MILERESNKVIDNIYRFSFQETPTNHYCYVWISNEQILKASLAINFYMSCIENNVYKIKLTIVESTHITEPVIYISAYTINKYLKENVYTSIIRTYEYISFTDFIKECI